MALLENPARISPEQRSEQNIADKRATLLAGLGWILTLGSLLGLPGPDFVFMGAAPALALISVFPALMGMYLQRYRGGFARLFLLAGAVALAVVGAFYLGRADGMRIGIAYFLPALLLAGAALVLAAPRADGRAT
jgi:hypothetical protein